MRASPTDYSELAWYQWPIEVVVAILTVALILFVLTSPLLAVYVTLRTIKPVWGAVTIVIAIQIAAAGWAVNRY